MKTLTTTGSHGFRPGDRIKISDTRRWWRKALDWLLRRPKPQLEFTVTKSDNATTLTVE